MTTRNELFQLGKYEIMESMSKFGNISNKQWDQILAHSIWNQLSDEIVNNLYLNNAKILASKGADFKTKVVCI